MRAVRHHLVVLAGLVVLALFEGVVPSLWALAGLVVSLGTHRVGTDLVMRRPNASPGVLLAIAIIGMALGAAAAVGLFMAFGWVTAAVFVVLWFVFSALYESKETRAWHQVRAVRSALLDLVGQQETGALTTEQLVVRVDGVLRRGFPGTRITTELVARLYERDSRHTDTQHRRLVALLNEWVDHAGQDEALRRDLRDKR